MHRRSLGITVTVAVLAALAPAVPAQAAGHNVIRLAKGSPFFAGGTGFAELDYIQLT